MKSPKPFGNDDKPVDALQAIRQWVSETHDENEPARDNGADMLMCPSCGHVRSVFQTDDGESKCLKCGDRFRTA